MSSKFDLELYSRFPGVIKALAGCSRFLKVFRGECGRDMPVGSRCLWISRGVSGRGVRCGSITSLPSALFSGCVVGRLLCAAVATVLPAGGSMYSEPDCSSDCSSRISVRSVCKV